MNGPFKNRRMRAVHRVRGLVEMVLANLDAMGHTGGRQKQKELKQFVVINACVNAHFLQKRFQSAGITDVLENGHIHPRTMAP